MTKDILKRGLGLTVAAAFMVNNISWAAPMEAARAIKQSSLRPQAAVVSTPEPEAVGGLKTAPGVADGLKDNLLKGEAEKKAEANFNRLVGRIAENLDDIRENGGLILDIDDTLLTSVKGRPETLNGYPSVTDAICDLLCSGFKIYIASATSYDEQAPRVLRMVVNGLEKRKRLETISNFVIYSAHGLSKRPFRVSGKEVKVDIDHNFTDKNKIDDKDIEEIERELRRLLLNWEKEVVKATADRLEKLSPGKKAEIKSALGIKDLEYETLKQKFIEFQREGIKKEFKNARPAYLDGKEPKINVYAENFPPNDTDEEAPWIEFRDKVMIALRIAVFEDRQYPVFRETIIESLKKALGEIAENYDIKPGGNSTVDIIKKGRNKATAIRDIVGPEGNRKLFFYIGDAFKTRSAPDAAALEVLPAENCIAVCKQDTEGEALRIGDDHHSTHRLILAIAAKVHNAGADGYGPEDKALAARLAGKLISDKEHRGKDGVGGINKMARIAILANRARDLKQGTVKGKLPPGAAGAEGEIDYYVPFLQDDFFQREILPLLKEKVMSLSKSKGLPIPESRRISKEEIEELWKEWTIRAIPNWRRNCRKEKIPGDIIEHYGRKRIFTLIDYNDYSYLESLPYGAELIAEMLFHSFVHPMVERQGTGSMSEEEIEDYILEVAPIEKVRRALKNTKEIDEYSDRQNLLEQKKRLRQLRLSLGRISRMMEKGYRRSRYKTILNNLREINLELNYMQVYPENQELFKKVLTFRHHLTGELSSVVSKHPDSLIQLRVQADEDLGRYISYAIASGITSRKDGQESLELARRNIEAWLNPANRIPEYIQQGLVRGRLEGRSGDIIYDYAGNVKSGGWKEFGTAGIRNEAVQSGFEIVRDLELEEFAEKDNEPRVPILTGSYLINSVSLIKQAMTIIKLISFIEHKIDTGQWPEEVSEEERKKWPEKFDKKFEENIRDKTITIAYDSRLNGRYFAYLLAAVFLQKSLKVNIFDSPAGVPGGVIVANGPEFFGELSTGKEFSSVESSIFGTLISASHSQAWLNGFKVFLGYQKSQVDKSMKEMLKDTMKKVNYDNMPLEKLTGKSLEELEEILRAYSDRLTWVGSDEPRQDFNYCGARLVPFYPLYYDYISRRSPLSHIDGEELKKVIEARRALRVLYTAFFGVGAREAADLAGFFNRMGYKNVEVVEKQTEEMDGRFPGHETPDPGVVRGWMSNLWNYIEQIAGRDFSGIKKAVDYLNEMEAGEATDPDIDRAAIMLDLPKGIAGNIKESFKKWVEEHIDKSFSQRAEQIKAKVVPALTRLEDKLLLTANDAWVFMAYYKLKIMERYGLLSKDKLYIIEKSQVTTSGLERVADYFRGKGHHIYVVDTYVGFTEIGKKSRDLFAVAKTAWEIKKAIEENKNLEYLHHNLKNKTYQEVKEHVPYETAGIKIIDEAIEYVRRFKDTQSPELRTKCLELLDIIAHMEILVGCEESNGYGELGRYIPEEDRIEGAHIADKDGSLAAYEFLELLSYGKAILGKSGYQMYTDMIKEIGWTATDNQSVDYPGFEGKEQKTNSISAIEKIIAMKVEKMLDNNQGVKFFGKYPVSDVTIYRDEKYDKIYRGFPEEGVRFSLATPSGLSASTTFKPSGTGNNNRNYNWIEAKGPGRDEEIEDYRKRINEELAAMVRTFFGEPEDTQGEHKPDSEHPRFLVGLRDVINSEEPTMELIKRALGVKEIFTAAEESLYRAVVGYVKSPAEDGAIMENTRAWDRYLSSEEAKEYPKKVNFYIENRRIQIPNALAKAWQASLVGYLSELVKYEDAPEVRVACDDPQIAEFVAKRTKNVKVKVGHIPAKSILYIKPVRTKETIEAVMKILAEKRPDIPAERITSVIRAHTHPKPRVVEAHKRDERLAEQVGLVNDLVERHRQRPVRTILVHNPYLISGELPEEKIVNITEVIAVVEDVRGALGRESTSIGKFGGYIIPDAFWSYDIGEVDGKKWGMIVFEIEKEKRGGGRFEDLTSIIEHYRNEGVRVFTKRIDAQGEVSLHEEASGESSAAEFSSAGKVSDPAKLKTIMDAVAQSA